MLRCSAEVEGARNYDFQRWPYFNWMLYDVSRTAAGVPRRSRFGDWIAAPVPIARRVTDPRRDFHVRVFAMFVDRVRCSCAATACAIPRCSSHFYRLDRASAKPQPSSLGAAAAAPVASREQRRHSRIGRSAMGDGRVPSPAQRVLLQLPALADGDDPVQLRRSRFTSSATSSIRFSKRAARGRAVTQFMLIFLRAARPRHQPGDGEIFRRVSRHAIRAARSPTRSSSSGFTRSAAMLAVAAARHLAAHLHARNVDRLPDLVRRPAHAESSSPASSRFSPPVPRAAALRLRASAGGADLRADSAHPDERRRCTCGTGA